MATRAPGAAAATAATAATAGPLNPITHLQGPIEKPLEERAGFTLKPTQDLAVHRFVQFEKEKKGIFLLHNVGSGKTITSITIAINSLPKNDVLDGIAVIDGNAFSNNKNVDRQIVVVHPTGLTKNYNDDMLTQIPRIHLENKVGDGKIGQKFIYSYMLDGQPQKKMYFLVHFLEYRDLKGAWDSESATMIRQINKITQGRIVIFDEAHRLLRPLLPGGNETIADKILSNKATKTEGEGGKIFGSVKRLILMTGTPFSKGVEDFGKLLAITNLSSITVDPDNVRLAAEQAYDFDFGNQRVKDYFFRSYEIKLDENLLKILFGAVARTVRGVAVGDSRIYGMNLPFLTTSPSVHPKPEFEDYTGKRIKEITKRQINKEYNLAYDNLSWRAVNNFFNRRTSNPTFRKLLADSFKKPESLMAAAGRKRTITSRRRSQKRKKQRGGDPVSFDEAKSIFGYTTEEITDKDVGERYKKLALQLHPDRSTGDTDKFQKLQNARDALLSSKSTESGNPIDSFVANAMYFALLDMNRTERELFVKKLEVVANSEQFKNASKTLNQEYLEVEMLSMLPHQYYNVLHASIDFVNKLETEDILSAMSQPIPPEIEKQYYENVAIVNDITTFAVTDSVKPALLTGGEDDPEIKLTEEEESRLAGIRVLAEYVRLWLLVTVGGFIRTGENPEYLVLLNDWILMNDEVIEDVNDMDLVAADASMQKVLAAIGVLDTSASQTGGVMSPAELGSSLLSRLLEIFPTIAETLQLKKILAFGGGIIKLTPVGTLIVQVNTLIEMLVGLTKTAQDVKVLTELYAFSNTNLRGIYGYITYVPATILSSWFATLGTAGILMFVMLQFGYRTAVGRGLRTTVSLLGKYVDNAVRGTLKRLSGDPAESTFQALYAKAVKNGDTYYAYLLRAQLEADEYFDGDLDISKFAGKSREYLSLIDSVMPIVNVDVYKQDKYLSLLKEVYNNNRLTVEPTGFNYPARKIDCIYVPYTPEQMLLSKHIENLKSRGNRGVPDLGVAPWYVYTPANELGMSLIGNVSRSVVRLQKRQIGPTLSRPPAIYNPNGETTIIDRGNKRANVCLNRYMTNTTEGTELSFECPKFKKILDYLLFMKLGYMLSIDGSEIVEQPHFATDDTNDSAFITQLPIAQATRHWLPFVFSTSDELGLNLFGAYLNEKGYKYITLHDNDSGPVNTDNLKAATDMSWSLLKDPHVQHVNQENIMDFVMKNLIGFDKAQQKLGADGRREVTDFEGRFLNDAGKAWIKTQPLCILLHPFKTEGINGKHNPAIIMMEPPKNYGDYEQLCGRVLRTYSGMYPVAPVKRVYQVMGYTYPGIKSDLLDPFDGVEANVNATTTVERAEVGLFFDTANVSPEDYTDYYDAQVEVIALKRKTALNYAGYYSLTDITHNAGTDLASLENLADMISNRNKAAFQSIWTSKYSKVLDAIVRNETYKSKLLDDIRSFKDGSVLGAFKTERQYENETSIGVMKGLVSEYNTVVIGSILGQLMRDINEQFVKSNPDDINQVLVKSTAPYTALFDVLFGIDDANFVNEATITSEIHEIKAIQKNAYLFGKYLNILKGGAAGGIERHIPDLDEIIARVEKVDDAATKQQLYNSRWCNAFPPTEPELCRNKLEDVARNLQEDYANIMVVPPIAAGGTKRRTFRNRKHVKTRKVVAH